MGLAVTIALAFVPQTILQLVAIREAQRVRGHRFRGWRDALPLLVPLISGGLERSLQLAEAMDSRGYGGGSSLARPSLAEQGVIALGGALSALCLFFVFYQPAAWFPMGLLAAGGLLLALVAWRRSRIMRRTRYLREHWRARDLLVIAGSLLAIALSLFIRQSAPDTLTYLPLPRASLPSFHGWSVALVLLLLMPALITLVAQRSVGGPSTPPADFLAPRALQAAEH
jgi:energy-coupling factor transport system permease protein